MTPLWRRAVKQALGSKIEFVRLAGEGLIVAHHCFDLADVFPLVKATADELRRGVEYGATGRRSVVLDLGERAVFPASSFWFEWGRSGVLMMPWGTAGLDGRAAMLITERVDQAGRPQPIWAANHMGLIAQHQMQHVGHIAHRPDGLFEIHAPAKDTDPGIPGFADTAEAVLFYSFASLALISSPSAARDPVEPHRGLAREISRSHPRSAEAKASKIVIRVGPGPSGAGQPRETTSPRAYHFCRAHTRLRHGKTERVRAHWRGDPAFGIRIGSYSVKSGGAA